MEDLDTPRVVPGAADDILRTLELFGLTWDDEVVFQSTRLDRYERALEDLLTRKAVYACACSRADLARAASAPTPGEGAVYPGTCRDGLPGDRVARAFRFRVPAGVFTFEDLLFGSLSEDVFARVGDFVVKRADGPFAYQLAVVVDDAAQGVTEVVRGADLLDSTARQIALQRALGLATPAYAHLPLIVGADGKKLGKRGGALPVDALDERRVRAALASALDALGQETEEDAPRVMLQTALRRFDPRRIPLGTRSVETLLRPR
jgi:glutamyl-Q tRNA(Asp) synthetase